MPPLKNYHLIAVYFISFCLIYFLFCFSLFFFISFHHKFSPQPCLLPEVICKHLVVVGARVAQVWLSANGREQLLVFFELLTCLVPG